MPSKLEKQRLHLEKLAANCRNLQQNSEPSSNVPPDNPASSLNHQQLPHLPAFPLCSKEEILSEYMNFLRHLPPLIEKEKVKVIETVKSYLKIDVQCRPEPKKKPPQKKHYTILGQTYRVSQKKGGLR
jgi:hypothetical protein